MKKSNHSKYLAFILVGALSFGSCADLSVENQNDPDIERALANDSDVENLLKGGGSTLFFATLLDVRGSHMALQADQITSTNRSFSFWDFSDQPRIRYNNRSSYSDADIFYNPWANLNSAISTANDVLVIAQAEGASIEVSGEDITDRMIANSLFLRGVSRGYIAAIYDQGYIVNEDSDLGALELTSASDILAAGIADIKAAITKAEGTSNYVLDIIAGEQYTLNQMKAIANSYMAKLTAASARNASQAASVDWAQVLAYANAGLGQPGAADGGAMANLEPASIAGVFFNEASDWMNFNIGGAIGDEPSGYLPVDVKVTHMLNTSYPTDYPTDPNVILDPATSDDPRLGYFIYTENFGFLNPARRRALFTNYFNVRMYADNDWTLDGNPTILFTKAEVDYLRAEANIMGAGTAAAAATILNTETPFGTAVQDFALDLPSVQAGYLAADGMAGGNVISPTATTAEFQFALLKEYSVEIQDLGAMGTQWFFMRRHDLLQEGSGTQYAIPGQELEITSLEYYTFGGSGSTDEGTATGSNSWKSLSSKIPASSSLKAGIDGRTYTARSADEFPNLFNNMKVHPRKSDKISQ